MVIGIIGESCTGKSSIANELSKRINAKVYAGNDYTKLAKSETEARQMFSESLNASESGDAIIVYVITEAEHITLLPPKALRVLVTADLDVIKERFAKRMNGKLPAPVAAMLETKHGMFDEERNDLHIHNVGRSISDICDRILALCGK